ncbi:short-chain dehydrogenase/reductase family 16C member 6-like [Pseudomyrmex gracilis]|uniref:short-chain dehydrogenase/reductase family 16C member 6-like n=1 Tax=Pseudomyrmex gracilis TaxID=219809 RepID=UPI000994CA30|nr:short-chain dehydrogenase/reductase family 16C member 6-like [Pseudomyrmex gracilis]XP_020300385.1 short-chain dehydrogenase/reductase family 16C member 6-like [Pseudomyrmex gracilis]XP_020300386.1 short-chain dehydrogenase/reductase family 16C member 6-like [Pseudomyrmex gracilis]XP_020300387.1 short-chain dehydrogenase/reductase family 16C member 6-like [Pseudomyrmex gracilis]XP_020300389.1 short-chain dehydrogenase/reductase family 16C member 6-like [Pseudomyrmex gracilis]XP_020300390.1 
MEVLEIVLILIEILLVILKILYYICESLYKVFIPMKKKNVAGEIVLITGAAQGIGKELALGYAALGARVVCWDIDKSTNEQTVDTITRAGGSAYAYKCDVSNREEVVKVAEKVKKEVGDVTILINNAGIAPVRKFLDWSVEEIKRVIDVNLMAHYWTLQEFLPKMIEKNHGHIVTISSLASIVTGPHGTTYCASKAAVTALTDCLRLELDKYYNGRSPINFTLILPSFVRTKLVRRANFKFPFFVQFQSPQKTAGAIIDAQRQNVKELSIPSSFSFLIKCLRVLPQKAYDCIHDFLGINVEVDDPSESYI